MSERLTLQDLVDLLSDKQNVTKKDAETFLRELVALISETIEQKDFVRIKDFGTFKLTPVNARRSVDVNTGDPIEIPAHYKLSFTPDKVLREGVNRPFSHFESILLDDEVVFEDKETAESKPAVKPEPKKAEVKPTPAPKKEAPKKVEPTKKEEVVIAAKIDEVPKQILVEDEVVIIENEDLRREEELTDLNSFLAKGVEDKKEEKPLAISRDSSDQKESVPPTPRKVVRKYDDEDDDDFVDYEYIAQQKKKRNTWIGVGVLILVLLGVGIWGYNYLDQQQPVIPYAQNNSEIIISGEEKPAAKEPDTVAPIVTEDPKVEDVVTPVVEEQPVATPPASTKPEQGAREIEVKSGQTMRVLGMEYYGHGAFWVYIFEENRDKISRPDAVFAGMKLIIPPASKYGIDPDDKDSVRKAQKQELKLFGEFSEK